MNVVTLEEIKAFLRLGTTTDAMDAPLTLIANGAEAWVAGYCGIAFAAAEVTDFLSGGERSLRPYRLPLVSISEIHDLFWDEKTDLTGIQIINGKRILNAALGAEPMQWPDGQGRYKTKYVGGYKGSSQTTPPAGSVDPPEGIKLGILSLIRRIWETRGGVKNYSTKGLSIQWDDIASGEIATMLQPYVLKDLI